MINKEIQDKIKELLKEKEECVSDCECILCFLQKCFCYCGNFIAKECEYCRKKICINCWCPRATYMCIQCDLDDVSDSYYRT